MSDRPPTNAQEYLDRFAANQKIEGFGIGNVHVHMPCPFCAAADFLTYELLETQSAMVEGSICRECKRGARAIVVKNDGGMSFEIVQTVGPDQPEWLTPKMRRLDRQ